MALRSTIRPLLVILVIASCAVKLHTPRTANSRISATGTVHKASVPFWKPRSSSGCSRAGISGSVRASISVAPAAVTQTHSGRPK